MKKLLYLILVISVSFVACKKEELEDIDLYGNSTYPQLNGSYTYYDYSSWEDGLYEISEYISWDFNETRRSWYYRNYWSYTTSGWTNALKEPFSAYKEWKIENGMFKEIIWDNQFDSWSSHTFEYIDANHINIDGKIFTKDN